MTVYDSYGRRMEIDREEWRTQVLPHALHTAWDNPAELAGHVQQGLVDGFTADVLPAARHLWEIATRGDGDDDAFATAGVLLGVCLIELDQPADAETVLRAVVARVPDSAAAWINLAKTAGALGRGEEQESLVQHALDADPNYENAVNWYAGVAHERDGMAGWERAMAEIAQRPGSWQAQLWLGRHALVDDGDLHGALTWFNQALDRALDEPKALMMVTGELGKAGHVEDLLEVGLARWRPQAHGVETGRNLLEAALQRQQVDIAEDVLHRLHMLQQPNLPDVLREYESRVDELRAQRFAALRMRTAETGGPLEVTVLASTRPLWWEMLGEPGWALPERDPNAPTIAFFSLWAKGIEGEPRESKTEWRGRLCRGVPLWLADQVRLTSLATAATVQHLVPGGGAVLTGAPSSSEFLVTTLRSADVDADLLVTGFLDGDEQAPAVTLEVFDSTGEQRIATLGPLSPDAVWPAFARALDDRGVGVSDATSPEHAAQLASGEEMLFSLVTAARGLTPADSLWGERGMLEWLLALAAQRPPQDLPRLLYAAALFANRAYGSSTYAEFERRTRNLYENEPPSPLFAQLRPTVEALFTGA